MKIAHKLLLTFLVFTLLILLVGYFAVSTSHQTLKTHIGNASASLAAEILNKIEKDMFHKTEVFQDYSRDLTLQQVVSESNQEFEKLDNIQAYIDKKDQEWTSASKEAITPLMRKLMSNELSEELIEKLGFYNETHSHTVFGEVFVTNKYGANIAQTGKTTDYRQDDEEWWQNARRDGVCIGGLEYDKSAGIHSVHIALRIDDKNGTFVGVMKVIVSVEELADIVRAAEANSQYKNTQVNLTDAEGRVVSSTHHDLGKRLYDEQLLKKIDNDQGYFEVREHGPGKGDVLLSYAVPRGYKAFADLGWILFIEHQSDDIFAPATTLRNKILVISLVVTIFAILMSFLISRRISNPVAKLREAAIQIGNGKLDAEIEVESDDEIGELAGSFKKMTEDIKKTTTSIEHLNKEVAQRKQAEQGLQRSYQVQTTLNKLLHLSLGNISLKEVLELFLYQITSIPWLSLESKGAIFLVEDDPEVLVLKAQQGLDTRIQTMCARIPFGRCLCGRAALSRDIDFADCVGESHENRYDGIPPHGHYCVPIFSDNKVLGVMTLYVREGHPRKESEEEFLRAASHVLSGIVERKQAEAQLQNSTHELRERVKELNCLYRISDLVEKEGITLEEILQGVADLIPPSWQYPKTTCARITLDDQEFRTENFRKTTWKQAANLTLDGERIGTVEVFCLEEKPESDEASFIKEERALLDAIAERLARIIERRRVQETLTATDARLKLLVQSGPAVIFSCEPGGDYAPTFISENVQDQLGYKAREFLDDPSFWPDHIHPEDRSHVFAELPSLLEQGRLRHEYRFQHKDGSYRWMYEESKLVCTAAGKPLEIVGYWLDITERKHAEIELGQARKLEAVGQLAAGIAHEINTPTQFVGDNITFLQDALHDIFELQEQQARLLKAAKTGKVSKDIIEAVESTAKGSDIEYLAEEIPKAVEQSLDGVDRISKIVRAMKEFSHPGATGMTDSDINEAIDTTITVTRNEWKYVAEMKTELDPSLPPVPCLVSEFNQVILNLIINAAQAIGDVVGDGKDGLGTITVGTAHHDNWAEIRVSDTGKGIPKGIMDRIFEPFFTTKDVGKGSGQGLAIARSVIMNKHHGQLSFETEEGKGTTFVVRLPLTADTKC